MQSQRSPLYEYFGIRPIGSWEGINIYRPLLDVTKQALMDYCLEKQIPYAIDQSNAKLIYQRNRIRAQLSTLSPSEKRKKQLAFEKENNHRRQRIQFLKPFISKRALVIKTYLNWDRLTQFLFWILFNESQKLYTSITDSWLKKIEQILRSKKPNVVIPYSKGWHLEKAYDQIWFINDQDAMPYYFLNPRGTISLPRLNIQLDHLKHLPETFILRSCQPNDLLHIKNYAKPFRRLAIDWKMPLFLRRVWPVFTTLEGEVILLPRYQKNHVNKANNWLEILE
jgi:tRNA(Ile)-lysidine synthase